MLSLDWVYKKRASQKNILMLIPEKNFFSHKYIILAMLALDSKVNFLFFLLHHFVVVRVGWYPVLCTGSTRLRYNRSSKKKQWKASIAAIRNTETQRKFSNISDQHLLKIKNHGVHNASRMSLLNLLDYRRLQSSEGLQGLYPLATKNSRKH